MAFNWRREPSNPYLPADGSMAQMAANSMAGYQPLTAMTPHGNGMNGYFSNDTVANQSQGFSVPNQQHGGMGQPELDGYGASLQAASDAAAQAQAREQQIADIQSQIETLQARIAENQAKLKNWNGGDVANKVAALEARKFFSQDPTSIWRWKQEKDYATQLAAKQKETDNTTKANAMIEIANDLDSIIVDDKMTSQDQKAYLSKLSNMKTLGEKAGVPKSVIDNINAKIAEVKGDGGEQTSREKAQTDWKGLKDKPDLTSNEIQTALDNPDMNWDPDERKEAENLRDKLKKHETATQDVKDMKSWVEKTYGTKWHTLSPRLQETYQRLWKNRKGKK